MGDPRLNNSGDLLVCELLIITEEGSCLLPYRKQHLFGITHQIPYSKEPHHLRHKTGRVVGS